MEGSRCPDFDCHHQAYDKFFFAHGFLWPSPEARLPAIALKRSPTSLIFSPAPMQVTFINDRQLGKKTTTEPHLLWEDSTYQEQTQAPSNFVCKTVSWLMNGNMTRRHNNNASHIEVCQMSQHHCEDDNNPTQTRHTRKLSTFAISARASTSAHDRRVTTAPPPGTRGSASQFQHRSDRGSMLSKPGPSGFKPRATTCTT